MVNIWYIYRVGSCTNIEDNSLVAGTSDTQGLVLGIRLGSISVAALVVSLWVIVDVFLEKQYDIWLPTYNMFLGFTSTTFG
jgi:hypothetical protein